MLPRNKEDLEELLRGCECPFTWAVPELNGVEQDQFIYKMTEKSENVDEENDFKWHRFVIRLVLSLELWRLLGDIRDAFNNINNCLDELNELSVRGCQESLFISIQGALRHITLATKAHLQFANRDYHVAALTLSEIPNKQILSIPEQGGLWGIKAAFLKQYPSSCTRRANEAASVAVRIDPKQAEWYFIRGTCSGRIRRIESIWKPSDEEINDLEYAYNSNNNNASYACGLAQTYVDYLCYAYLKRYEPTPDGIHPKKGFDTSKEYASIVVNLYKKALKLRPHDFLMKVRIAHGLLKIPQRWITDCQLAKSLLEEAKLFLPNSSMLHHDLGKYYLYYAHDLEKAVECLEQAHKLQNYKSFLLLTNIWWKNYDRNALIPKIIEGLNQYRSDVYKSELYVLLGTCHLLLYEDWDMAVRCFNNSLQLSPDGKYMKKFCGFIRPSKTNILEVVTNELRQKTDKNAIKNECFNRFLQIVSVKHPSLCNQSITPGLFSEFKQKQMKKVPVYNIS